MGFSPGAEHVLPVSRKPSAGFEPGAGHVLPENPSISKEMSSITNLPFIGRGPTEPETNEAAKGFRHGLAGYAQGALNIIPQTLNMVNPTSHKLPTFNFAPEDTESRIGQVGSAFMGPQAAESATMKILPYLPKTMRAMKDIGFSLETAAKESPAINKLLSMGKTGAKAGYINMLANPQGNAWSEFGKGAALGMAGDILAPAAISNIPVVNTLAKAGLGGMAGYGIGGLAGHPKEGAAAGMAVGAGFPVRKFLGIEPEAKIAGEMLSGIEPTDVDKAVKANRALGTNITPGEASGNYVARGNEGRLKTGNQAVAQQAYRFEEQEKQNQGNAVKRMLNKIYNPTKKNENAINDLYTASESDKYNLDPVVVNAMLQDPMLAGAVKTVENMAGMEEVAPNNYKFLSQVKRQLDKNYKALKDSSSGADRVEANNILQMKNKFNKFLGDNNPDYEAANALAHPRFVREELESQINREPENVTAKRTYSALFKNRATTNEVIRKLKGFPEAQRDVVNMKNGWKHLTEMKTTGQAEAQSASNIQLVRNTGDYIKNVLQKIAGTKGDIARLKYIYSKDWEKGFEQVANQQDKVKRMKDIGQYLTNTGVKIGLASGQVDNLIDWLNSTESGHAGK